MAHVKIICKGGRWVRVPAAVLLSQSHSETGAALRDAVGRAVEHSRQGGEGEADLSLPQDSADDWAVLAGLLASADGSTEGLTVDNSAAVACLADKYGFMGCKSKIEAYMASQAHTAAAPAQTTDSAPLWEEWDTVHDSFDNMGLRTELLAGIHEHGLVPLPCCKRGIVPFTQARDLICVAPAKAGRTGMFSVGILNRLDYELQACQAVVLSRSAWGVQRDMHNWGKHLPVNCHASVSKQDVRLDFQALQQGCKVLVGTIGRVHQLVCRRRLVNPATVRMLVIQLGDELMSPEIEKPIQDIARRLKNPELQLCLVGPGLGAKELAFIRKHMRSPVRVVVSDEEAAAAQGGFAGGSEGGSAPAG